MALSAWTDRVTATLAGTSRAATGTAVLPTGAVDFAIPPEGGGPTEGVHSSPDQLLASAAASCWLLSFAVSAQSLRVPVREARAEASVRVVPEGPGLRIERIEVRPRITVVGARAALEARVRRACEAASRYCIVERALRPGVADYRVEPEIDYAD